MYTGIKVLCCIGLSVAMAGNCAAAESFVVAPSVSKKKTISKAALADDLEINLKDLIAALNILIQDAARFQEHYLSEAYALDEDTQTEELSRLLNEIKRVQKEIDAMLAGMHTIKNEIAVSNKTVVQAAESTVKKAP